MDSTPLQKITRSAALAASALAVTLVSAHAYEWRSLTSFSEARRMAVINDTLYIATSGGMLAVTDPDSRAREYTNLSALETVDVADVIEAADGATWVAGNGRLIRWGDGGETYPVNDNDGAPFRLMRLADDGDYLWLGSNAGLILFAKDIDGGQMQDAFQLFDDLNPAPQVNDILLVNDSIWLATSAGLAGADRSDFVALKSPANWKGYTFATNPEMGSDTVRAVAAFEGSIYVGTDAGLFRLEATDVFTQLAFSIGSPVYQFMNSNDSLYVFSEAGLGVVVGGAAAALATPGVTGGFECGAIYDGALWLGRSDRGLYYQSGGSFAEYPYVGLPNNDVADVAIAPDGRLAVLFHFLGPYEQTSSGWIHWPVNVVSHGLAMKCDQNSNFYIGTYGGGMSRVSDTVARFTALNSTLQEATAVGTNYVVCYDVALSSRFFFGANFEPRDGTRVAIAALDGMDSLDGWMSLGVADGLNATQMVSIDEQNGAFAVGSGVGGVFYYYYGSDPFDPSDDSLVHYYRTQPNFRYRIISDIVRVVRFSPEGALWVGTNFGISRFDLGFESFVEVELPAGFGPDITALEFDSRGSVWIGARNGLARIDYLTGDLEVFTSADDGLLNDYVNNLTFDKLSGDLYVSTPSGVSVVLSTYGPPTDDVAEAYAFPNPYVISTSDDLLNFNFSGNARLRVFTVAGDLVAERPEPVWDGRNDAGERVASGVYLYVLTDDQGNVGRGKFLLVRQ